MNFYSEDCRAIRAALANAAGTDPDHIPALWNTAKEVAAFLDALPPDLRVEFHRPLTQHEIDVIGPYQMLASMVRQASGMPSAPVNPTSTERKPDDSL